MNTIIIDKIDKIRGYGDCAPNNFIFQNFKIVFKGSWFRTVRVELNPQMKKDKNADDTRYIIMEINDGYNEYKIRVDFYSRDGLTYNYAGGGVLESTFSNYELKYESEELLDRWNNTVCDVLSACNYIMTAPRNKTQRKGTDYNYHKGNTKNKQSKYIDKKVFLLDEIIEYVDKQGLTTQSTGTHDITCPCWGVRGHYRHYKSGKTIFVKEFKKGKDRETAEPQDKIYTV